MFIVKRTDHSAKNTTTVYGTGNLLWLHVAVRGSSVGIETDYGLDSSGSNPGGDEIFRQSRPALGPIQPPENGYRVFPGGKMRPGRAADQSSPSSSAVMEE